MKILKKECHFFSFENLEKHRDPPLCICRLPGQLSVRGRFNSPIHLCLLVDLIFILEFSHFLNLVGIFIFWHEFNFFFFKINSKIIYTFLYYAKHFLYKNKFFKPLGMPFNIRMFSKKILVQTKLFFMLIMRINLLKKIPDGV